MSMPVPLALVWHQHQPYYKDMATGEMLLPWVRLHGIKDYYGMARLLREFPGVHCTINLVPSMLVQLLDYTEHGATDPFLRHTLMPADGLSRENARFILDHFFMAQWDRMIRVYPRYRELLDRRNPGKRTAEGAAGDFSIKDFRDLQVWFNLAWFHPVSFEESQTLRELVKKGRDFTEQDKAAMTAEQNAVLARVIPLHKELARRNQAELTTTPFYHPILPLLKDMRACLEAMPRNPLPNGHISLSDDAEVQIKRAVEFHTKLFGIAPQGMWPSEGSVSLDVVPLISRHGIRWIGTDEEILGSSLDVRLRGGFGKLERPDLLYRPWQVQTNGSKLNMVFRDHHLSDLIGFQYQGWDGALAAGDFLARVQASGSQAPASPGNVVTVILDGENCWEHYPDQGIKFLRSLYAKLEQGKSGVTGVRVCDVADRHPPQHQLARLFAGSWINHDFYIWVGHAEDRRAWEYVYRVRQDLVNPAAPRAAVSAEDLERAWEELYIAEGSDWYWWYGDDHCSGNDEAFDTLFRTHLKNVYKFLGQPAPSFLDVPIKAGLAAGRYTLPVSSLNARIDGRCSSYFEWLGAGRYRADKEGGVMTAAGQPLLDQIYFGFDPQHLFVRIDLHDEPVMNNGGGGTHAVERVALRFCDLNGLALVLESARPGAPLFEGNWPADGPATATAWDECVEIKVPFRALGVKEKQELSFFVEVSSVSRPTERFPRSCALQFSVPPSNLHELEWMA